MEKKSSDWEILSKIYFRSSTKTRMTKRVYQKITEYLANVSSKTSSILIILFIITSFINYEKARLSIILINLEINLNLNIKKEVTLLKTFS